MMCDSDVELSGIRMWDRTVYYIVQCSTTLHCTGMTQFIAQYRIPANTVSHTKQYSDCTVLYCTVLYCIVRYYNKQLLQFKCCTCTFNVHTS